MFTPLARAIIVARVGLTAIPGITLLSMSGWPDMFQGMAGQDAMPLLAENMRALTAGFGFFIVSGLLWALALWFVADAVRAAGGHRDALAIVGLLIAASLAVRTVWYGVNATMNPIALELWSSGDAQTQEAIFAFLRLINDVLSTAQEDIGVNLIGTTAMLILSAEIIRLKVFPRWLGVWGVAAALMFYISSAELIGLNAGQVFAIGAPTAMNLWFIFLAPFVLKQKAAAADAA